MSTVILWVMALGAVLGGLDRIARNRFGLGEKFEEGFMLLGPTALSMAGIICIVPTLSRILEWLVAPLYIGIGVDPAMLGGLLAIDMGGYPLAAELARNPATGQYAGIIVAAVLGCTVTFTVPVGMGVLRKEDRPYFAKGMLYGLIAMPAALIVGGLMSGLSMAELLWQNIPVFVFSAALLIGIWKKAETMIRIFTVLASGIRILSTIGLIIGAFCYMTGLEAGGYIAPLTEAMGTVSAIGIVMLGSLPIAELVQRLLKKPLEWAGRRTGMNSASAAGLLIGMVSVLPAIVLLKDMDKRGKIVNGAFFVSAASMLAAHLGFTAGVCPDMIGALIAAKLTGGAAGILVALASTRHLKERKRGV